MFDKDFLEQLRQQQAAWAAAHQGSFATEDKKDFVSEAGVVTRRLYTPLDLADQGVDYFEDVGFPGDFPFTRGLSPVGYRAGLWKIAQYSGQSTPEECNALWRDLAAAGLNTVYAAYDLPTQLGYDPDHPMAEGEVGRTGVSLVSLRDWEIAFDGIDLGKTMVSTVCNAPGAMAIAMNLLTAQRQGVDLKVLQGSSQNDVLKEYTARGNFIFPPEPSMRLVVDALAYCSSVAPNFYPITVCSVHQSEFGANHVHEVAFALANGIAYVESAVNRGIDVDVIGPGIMWTTSHDHHAFFHEIAKLRAMRRLWARIMRDRFKARKPESMMCRLYSSVGGTSLMKEQYLNNIARSALAALAGALAGAQRIDLRTYDEQWGIPTKDAEITNIRCQQIVGYECGAGETVDPLAGSYYVEWLTTRLETEATRLLEEIDRLGGMWKCLESGWLRQQFDRTTTEVQGEINEGKRLIVGANSFRGPDGAISRAIVDGAYKVPSDDKRFGAIDRVRTLRETRDGDAVRGRLRELADAVREQRNVVRAAIEATKAYATLGEMVGTIRMAHGLCFDPYERITAPDYLALV